MKNGYRPMENKTSEDSTPPNCGSSIMDQRDILKHSFEKKGGRNWARPSKPCPKPAPAPAPALNRTSVERDTEVAYLKGRADVMEEIINKLIAIISTEITCEENIQSIIETMCEK